jgi:hypothetical protein
MQRVIAGEIPAPQQKRVYELNIKTPFLVKRVGLLIWL